MTTVLCSNAYKAAKAVYSPASKLPKDLKQFPVLHCMKLSHNEGRVTLTQAVYDTEKDVLTSVTEFIPARVTEEFETCVPAKPFLDWLNVTQTKQPKSPKPTFRNHYATPEWVDDRLEFTFDPSIQILRIKAGNTRAEFKCIDAQEFPASPEGKND